MANKSVYVIAEAGVNHNGNLAMAFELIDAAAEAGADAVKFQTFKANNLVTKAAKKAAYQVKSGSSSENQLDMLQRLELPYESHFDLIKHCNKRNITFLSTAFDFESLNFLVNELKLRQLKIASGELTNAPFLLEHARTGADLFVSTGMANLGEIEQALGVIALGYTSKENPSIENFHRAFVSIAGRKALKEKVTILHCTTEYPAPANEINLRAMDTIRKAFGLKTGYSDHSEGITIPIAAVARGATLIEKHFTLDRNLDGPDHRASLEPSELKQMVTAIRITEIALGTSMKSATISEQKNRVAARKSIVAACDIAAGQKYSSENLTFKRPGSGASPFSYWGLLGKTSLKNWNEGDIICD